MKNIWMNIIVMYFQLNNNYIFNIQIITEKKIEFSLEEKALIKKLLIYEMPKKYRKQVIIFNIK